MIGIKYKYMKRIFSIVIGLFFQSIYSKFLKAETLGVNHFFGWVKHSLAMNKRPRINPRFSFIYARMFGEN